MSNFHSTCSDKTLSEIRFSLDLGLTIQYLQIVNCKPPFFPVGNKSLTVDAEKVHGGQTGLVWLGIAS